MVTQGADLRYYIRGYIIYSLPADFQQHGKNKIFNFAPPSHSLRRGDRLSFFPDLHAGRQDFKFKF